MERIWKEEGLQSYRKGIRRRGGVYHGGAATILLLTATILLPPARHDCPELNISEYSVWDGEGEVLRDEEGLRTAKDFEEDGLADKED